MLGPGQQVNIIIVIQVVFETGGYRPCQGTRVTGVTQLGACQLFPLLLIFVPYQYIGWMIIRRFSVSGPLSNQPLDICQYLVYVKLIHLVIIMVLGSSQTCGPENRIRALDIT